MKVSETKTITNGQTHTTKCTEVYDMDLSHVNTFSMEEEEEKKKKKKKKRKKDKEQIPGEIEQSREEQEDSM